MKDHSNYHDIEPGRNPGYLKPDALERLTEFAAPLKRHIEKVLKIEEGDRLLDVGCGVGADTLCLARIVGGGGFVVGVDYDEDLVAKAQVRAAGMGLSARVGYVKADAASIPFANDCFDACRCERLFQHIPSSVCALSEMVRVTKKGGRIVIADTDWGTLSIDTAEVEIERQVVRSLAGIFLDGYAGRKLFGQMKAQQLQNITIDIWPIVWTDYREFRATSLSIDNIERKIIDCGNVSARDLGLFLESLEEAQQRSAFFASGSVIIVCGCKPVVG